MNEIKSLSPYIIGGLLGYFLQDIPWIREFSPWLILALYVTLVIVYIGFKIRRFHKRTFIASRFDIWGKYITLFVGLVILGLAYKFEFIRFFGMGIFPTLSLILMISGLFYEKSIQFEITGDQLLVDFRGKSTSKLNKLDSYQLVDDQVELASEGKKIIIYDLNQQPDNLQKIKKMLDRLSDA